MTACITPVPTRAMFALPLSLTAALSDQGGRHA
jgi:hypothetical protein